MQYISLTYPQTASLLLQGYRYDSLFKVYLSSGSIVFPSLTAINFFSNNHTVSAAYPPFSGYEYPSKYYNVLDKNNLQVTLTSFNAIDQLYDIIIFNYAGYTKLSDHGFLIKN